ncbi:universal stress protein [Nocardioides sp. MAHUQ-72]|uniref:universal stress protein n=1 Tax=unclassified Nocardioides TaxID=2615069 RepID=UPI00361B2C1E
MSGAVIVGVDGSAASVRALRWAVSVAAGQQWDVEVVTAWPHTGPVFVREVPGHHSDARERARSAQRDAVHAALGDAPRDVRVTTVLENARPGDALSLHATDSPLLVLGDSGDAVGAHERPESLAGWCRTRLGCAVALVPADGAVHVLTPVRP